MKIPRYSLNVWGPLLVVAIQLYFWLHLRSVAWKDLRNDEIKVPPWIGAYEGFAPGLASVLTTTFLPLATVSCLAFYVLKAVEPGWVDSVVIVAMLSSAVLAGATGLAWWAKFIQLK